MGEKDLMSDKKVIIQGEEIDYGNMSDEELERLFIEIKERELELYEKVLEAEATLKYYEDYK